MAGSGQLGLDPPPLMRYLSVEDFFKFWDSFPQGELDVSKNGKFLLTTYSFGTGYVIGFSVSHETCGFSLSLRIGHSYRFENFRTSKERNFVGCLRSGCRLGRRPGRRIPIEITYGIRVYSFSVQDGKRIGFYEASTKDVDSRNQRFNVVFRKYYNGTDDLLYEKSYENIELAEIADAIHSERRREYNAFGIFYYSPTDDVEEEPEE